VSFPKGFKTLAGPGAHSAIGRFFIYRERFMPVKGKTKEDTRGIQIRFPTPMYEKLTARGFTYADYTAFLKSKGLPALAEVMAAEKKAAETKKIPSKQTFYGVIAEFYADGTVKTAITTRVCKEKPRNREQKNPIAHGYNRWFDTLDEAEACLKAARKEGVAA
jgi:hypothetical protein